MKTFVIRVADEDEDQIDILVVEAQSRDEVETTIAPFFEEKAHIFASAYEVKPMDIRSVVQYMENTSYGS